MLRVFVVDDSLVVRARLKEILEEQGCLEIVGESGNAQQAITEVRRLDPQVVILDVCLPGGGGLPVLTDIKARRPGTLVLVLTSYPYPQYRQAYLAAGADCFYDKTKDIQSMNDVLVELAQKHGGVPTLQPRRGRPTALSSECSGH